MSWRFNVPDAVLRRGPWVVLSAAGLALAVAVSGPASAREVWCPNENEVFDVNTGERYQTMVGPSTKIVETGADKVSGREVSWRGKIQECPSSANSAGCNFRVDHAESTSYTKSKNYFVGLSATGGGTPIPFPVGGFNYTTTTTKTTSFDVANTINVDPGTRYQPIIYVEFMRHHGEYVGRYDALNASGSCKYPYALNTTARFGNPSIDIATDPISSWEKL